MEHADDAGFRHCRRGLNGHQADRRMWQRLPYGGLTWRMPLTHRTTTTGAPTAQSPQIAIDIQSTGLLTACDGAMVENSDV